MSSIYWLLIFIVLLVVEIVTLGLTTIWFAGGALVAFLAALLGANIYVQLILFFVVSLGLLFLTRPLAMKYFNKNRTKTNVDSLIGQQGVVTSEIVNRKATGQVVLNGQEWTARSLKDEKIIPEGAVITVKEIQGVKLIVTEEAKNETEEK